MESKFSSLGHIFFLFAIVKLKLFPYHNKSKFKIKMNINVWGYLYLLKTILFVYISFFSQLLFSLKPPQASIMYGSTCNDKISQSRAIPYISLRLSSFYPTYCLCGIARARRGRVFGRRHGRLKTAWSPRGSS